MYCSCLSWGSWRPISFTFILFLCSAEFGLTFVLKSFSLVSAWKVMLNRWDIIKTVWFLQRTFRDDSWLTAHINPGTDWWQYKTYLTERNINVTSTSTVFHVKWSYAVLHFCPPVVCVYNSLDGRWIWFINLFFQEALMPETECYWMWNTLNG